MLFLKVYDAKEADWGSTKDDFESIIPENCRWESWARDDKTGAALTGDALLNFVNGTLFPTLKSLEVTADTPIKKSIVKATFEDANNYMKDGVLLRQVLNVIDELDLNDYNEIHAMGKIYESILRELQSARGCRGVLHATCRYGLYGADDKTRHWRVHGGFCLRDGGIYYFLAKGA